MKNKSSLLFLCLALAALLLGMLFGILAGMQYILPDFIKTVLPFNNLRPFHVTSVISWIVLSATGGVYYYLHENLKPSPAGLLPKIHFAVFLTTGILIYYSYYTQRFGGKEYLEFPPYLIVPIIFGWILFGVGYFKNIVKPLKDWPVYFWMWATGIILMVYHLSEAYLWLNPDIGLDFIRSLTIQWKAGGSFVGAWNMLVYGTAIFLMSKIKGDDSIGRSRLSFFFYFLGLTNLMFGWAHHLYIVPTAPWVRGVSYAISMTEWVILFSMIYQWKKSLPYFAKAGNQMSYKFLMAADFWIFLNLILALLFSIPAVNFFTHGTHVTVAHSMGTTIGINTTILLASLLYIARRLNPSMDTRLAEKGVKIFNVSLFFFWVSLLIAGVKKSIWMYFSNNIPFGNMQDSLHWVYVSFVVFGIGIFIGIGLIAIPLLKTFYSAYFIKDVPEQQAAPAVQERQLVPEEIEG
jgi:nitric oxide reductase subunit B